MNQAIIPVPTLSTRGYVKDGKNKMETLLMHYFLSDSLQSSLYAGRVTSFPKIVQQYAANPIEFIDKLTSTMQSYLERYYPAGVKLTIRAPEDFDALASAKYDLELSIEVIEPSGTQSYTQLVTAGEGRVQNSLIYLTAKFLFFI